MIPVREFVNGARGLREVGESGGGGSERRRDAHRGGRRHTGAAGRMRRCAGMHQSRLA